MSEESNKPKMKRAFTPKNVLEKKWHTLVWDGVWRDVFGEPADNAVWFVSGASASGKSSFVMQLAKKLCEQASVLYVSKEEGINQSFQRRMQYLRMHEVQGRLRVVVDDTLEQLVERLRQSKSPKFVVIDSFQYTEWTYEQAKWLVGRFPRKSFIFISQEYKGQPLGKPAARLKYMADVKVRVMGYKAYCMGRAIGEAGAYYTVWEEGVLQTSNGL